MRFLLVLLFFVSIAPLLLATNVVFFFEDSVGVKQTQTYSFDDRTVAEIFVDRYEAIVRNYQDGALFQKPLDIDEIQTDLASFCTQMQTSYASTDETKFELYVRHGMQIGHEVIGLSPL